MRRTKEQKLIRQYNEEIHIASDLEGEDLYTLDESEVEDFDKWDRQKHTQYLIVESINTLQDYDNELYVGVDLRFNNKNNHCIVFTHEQITEMYNYHVKNKNLNHTASNNY